MIGHITDVTFPTNRKVTIMRLTVERRSPNRKLNGEVDAKPVFEEKDPVLVVCPFAADGDSIQPFLAGNCSYREY